MLCMMHMSMYMHMYMYMLSMHICMSHVWSECPWAVEHRHRALQYCVQHQRSTWSGSTCFNRSARILTLAITPGLAALTWSCSTCFDQSARILARQIEDVAVFHALWLARLSLLRRQAVYTCSLACSGVH